MSIARLLLFALCLSLNTWSQAPPKTHRPLLSLHWGVPRQNKELVWNDNIRIRSCITCHKEEIQMWQSFGEAQRLVLALWNPIVHRGSLRPGLLQRLLRP